MVLTKEFVYDLLSTRDGYKDIVSIEEIHEEPGVAAHQNFLSQVLRVTVQVKTERNEKKSIKMIVKKGDHGLKSNGFTSDVSFFVNESQAYEFLANVAKFIKSKDPSMEMRWAECFYSRVDTTPFLIILQDLSELNYRMWPKGRGLLDIQHATIAAEYLGKCHAMTRLYVSHENTDPNLINETKYEYLQEYFQAGLKKIEKAVRIYNENWAYIGDYLNKISGSVIDMYKQCYRSIKNDFPVLSMGDVWTTNILFKYEQSDCRKPSSAMFIDFQFAGINSFAWDLQYLFYLSMLPRLRLDNIDNLISCYQKSFAETMSHLGGDPGLVPTCQEIKTSLDKLLLTSFLYSMICAVEINASTDDDYQRTKDAEAAGAHSSLDWYLTDARANGYIDNIKYFDAKGLFQK